MKIVFCAILASFVFSLVAKAQEQADENAPPDAATTVEERARVKKRLYPGGRDEDSLQVQTQLATPTRGAGADEPADPADHD